MDFLFIAVFSRVWLSGHASAYISISIYIIYRYIYIRNSHISRNVLLRKVGRVEGEIKSSRLSLIPPPLFAHLLNHIKLPTGCFTTEVLNIISASWSPSASVCCHGNASEVFFYNCLKKKKTRTQPSLLLFLL